MRKVLAAAGACLVLLAGCGTSVDNDGLGLDVALDEQSLAESSRSEPIRLERGNTADLEVTFDNQSDGPIRVEHLRLEGEVLDMIFLSYDTAIDETIAPGEQRSIRLPIDFFDLGGQANGLLQGQVTAYDGERNAIAAESAIFDVRGGTWSTLTLFNLLLLTAFGGSLFWNLTRMAAGRLPVNRFLRGLRFTYTGVAAGLTLAVAFSLLRLWPLGTAGWLSFAVIGGIIGFAVGYLAPGSTGDDDDDVLDLLTIDQSEAETETLTT